MLDLTIPNFKLPYSISKKHIDAVMNEGLGLQIHKRFTGCAFKFTYEHLSP
jgi:hypothetical protein